jgi:DNA-binding transcriptional regulator GbsR (MarR family)
VYLSYDSYNLQEILQLLRISISTIYRILKCYQQWRCVINPFSQQVGRRKLFNGLDMKVSLFYYHQNL